MVAGALLGKLRPQMTTEQENTVDALKKACPGYAVMRSLVMSFRHILRTGKIKTLRAWMKKADTSGIYRMQRFVRTLRQDQSAVESAVEQSWSNGPVAESDEAIPFARSLDPTEVNSLGAATARF